MLAGAGPTAFAEKAKSAQSGKPRTARSGNEGELPTPLPLEEETEHVVMPGETLGGIANRAKVPKILIIEANHLKPPHYAIRTGQKLHLPRTPPHRQGGRIRL
jgi:LysM repeat protein